MRKVRRSLFALLALAVAAACSGGGGTASAPSAPHVVATAPSFAVPLKPSFAIPPQPAFATPAPPSAAGQAPAVPQKRPAFFAGETPLGNGSYALTLPGGTQFGTYAYMPDSRYISHTDMGYEYVVDANDANGGVYLYDFASAHWWYTSRTLPFPYIYDFSLNALLYYYADAAQGGSYTKNPRYFYDFASSRVMTMPDETPAPAPSPSTAPSIVPTLPPLPTGTPTPSPTDTPTATPAPGATPTPGTTPTPAPTAAPTAVPTLLPLPSPVASPSSLSFTSTATGSEQSFRVTEDGFTGLFTADGTPCNGIANVVAGAPGYFTVYPLAAGKCDIPVMDVLGGSTSVHVTVTTTTIGGQ